MNRQFRRKRSLTKLLAGGVVILVIAWRVAEHFLFPPPLWHMEVLVEGDYHVLQVQDSQRLVVRPAGNNTQQLAEVELNGIVPFADLVETANQFTRRFLESGRIYLRQDVRRISTDRMHLAYVFVGDQMLNAELVRQGLAKTGN